MNSKKKKEAPVATILVVSGHAACRLGVRRYLQGMKHKVIMAGSGSEGVEADRRNLGNLVIIDTPLPDMPLDEILGCINQNRRLMRDVVTTDVVPSILITNTNERFDEARLQALGVVAKVTKPLNLKALGQAVTQVLSGELKLAKDDRLNVCVLDAEQRARNYFSTMLQADDLNIIGMGDVFDLTALVNGGDDVAILIAEIMSCGDDPIRYLQEFVKVNSGTHVIVCTAVHDEDTLNGLRKIGIENILTKPVNPIKLRKIVRELATEMATNAVA